jgi:leader peptidase (prepilin peptidase)/N-methyltransferase
MSGKSIILLAIVGLLIYISKVDFKSLKIPNKYTIALMLLGLGINLSPWNICSITQSILGLITGFAILYGLNFLGRFFLHHSVIGLGDAKLLAGLGAIFGYFSVIQILFIAALACLIIQIVRQPKNGLSSIIAFGPYLCAAGIGFSIYQMMSSQI